ncbi:MAG TPA: sensor histidine kinase [Beijerinckiaceae bacterium]|nr:sensor histidine kinase [Beijerinckiaceae bacterium]
MRNERIGSAGVTALNDPQRRTKLRTVYYIAAAVLALLVPLIILAGLWVRGEFNKSRRDLEEYLHARAATLSHRMEAEIRQQITVLQAIAALPSLDEPSLPLFHGQARRMVAAMPQWALIELVDAGTGERILSTARALGEAAPPARPDVVRRVAEAAQPLVHTVLPGEDGAAGEHAVMLYVPVIRDGGVRQVLTAGMRAHVAQDILQRETDDARLLTVLVDEREHILARSRLPEHFVGGEANPELRRAIAGSDTGLFVAPTLDGQEVFTSFRRSPISGWVSVAATDRAQFDELARRSAFATIATGVLSLTLAGVLAVFLFYNVMERRLAQERLAASRALSDLDARLLATTQQALAEQRKASSEREVLLREIYHRVKNNLQIIQSLLRLGSRDLGPDQREPFESAIRRIGAMARVHTLLYNSPDLGSIDFRDYLEGLVREVAEAFGAEERDIRTVLEAQSMRVPLDTAVPLAFVAVEILTNAFKHAFPTGRGGTITVAAGREGAAGVLTISDDGVGLPETPTGRRALGLTIVTKLVQQIGGTLEQPEDGRSTFRIRFPLEGEGAAVPPRPAA